MGMSVNLQYTAGSAVHYLLFCSLAYIFLQSFYRLYIHPLRKYPGPWTFAISTLPYHFICLRGDKIPLMRSLHAKYGHVVRVSPNELSYIHVDAWSNIYGHNAAGKKGLPKDAKAYPRPVGKACSLIAAADDDHTRIRRAFSPAFSDRALKMQEPLLKKYMKLLVGQLKLSSESAVNNEVNIIDMYNFTAFDIMAELAFSESLHLLEDGAYTPWVKSISASMKAAHFARIAMSYPLVRSILELIIPKSLVEKRKALLKFSADRVDKRLKLGSDKPDIWSLVLDKDGENVLDVDEMHANALIFMIAGTETTATLLSGLTFHLLKNPEKMKKLTAEVRGAFSNEEDITNAELARLDYLRCCISEALRMYPPLPNDLARYVPGGGTVIAGKWVPGGTTVSVAQDAAYSSPRNFKYPEMFIPERWSSDTEFEGDIKDVLHPFSYGGRDCLGKSLAYYEIRLIISYILLNFDLTLSKRTADDWPNQKTFMLWDKKPLFISLKPRGN